MINKFKTLDEYKEYNRNRLAKFKKYNTPKTEPGLAAYAYTLASGLSTPSIKDLFKQGERIDAKVGELQEAIENLRMIWEK